MIATDTVVCAAGAWAREIGAMVGLEIPVHGEPRHMWFSPERGGLREDLPLTIDFTTSFYFHAEGPGIVFGGREVEIEEIAEHALERLPLILELPIQSNWWGYYEVSPDHNAIVGEVSAPVASVRDGLLGPRLPAVARDRRAHGAARARRGAVVQPQPLRTRALRPRGAARRALRRLSGPASRWAKTSDRATAVSSTPPTYRSPKELVPRRGFNLLRRRPVRDGTYAIPQGTRKRRW